ncbi:hypothetical protein N7523_006434 [Penicillium sp. IBT 18751x]|nr:hypothetical protein N7523_006434 [Penicillium sp. IBT 18751x]
MVTWSHEADKRLLVEIYNLGSGSIDWDEVARRFGDGKCHYSLSPNPHVRGLKKQLEASSKDTSVTGSGVSKTKRAVSRNKSTKGEKEHIGSDAEERNTQSDEN